MTFVLGIDIGTSFSAAAVARLDASQPVPQVLNLGVRGGAVPSVIFLGEDGQVLVGEAAERRGTTHPDRLVREFKRRVGDAVPIVVGDLSVAPEDIVATMARWVVDRAQEREGEPPAGIAMAHPASWGGYKRDLIRQALAGVGLSEVTLVSEPEAAAVHYASQERVDEGSTIAVYDLGGGTFDAAVLQKSSAEAFRTLGRPEGIERLGGADFDDAVFRHVASCAADSLAGLDTTDAGVLMALARLRRECTEAKEALSTDSEASIPVLLPGGQSQVRLVRSEFEAMIDDGVQTTIEALRRAMQAAGTDAEGLSAILLIGGSSRIPLVAQLLSAEFNRPIAIDADPKASISLGAAYSAAVMMAPLAAGAQPDPDNPAPPEEASVGIAAAGETAGHGHGFGADTGTAALVASAKPAHPRTGARMTAVAAAVATLTILTATAAQSPADMNSLAAGAAGAQAPGEGGETGTASPPGVAAGAQGSGAGGPTGIPVMDGSGRAPITDNWQAVDAGDDPVAGTAPADGTSGATNNDGGSDTPPKGSNPGTTAPRQDSPSSTLKPATKGTTPSTAGQAAESGDPAQVSSSPAPQPEPLATGPAPTTPAQPPATQPPVTAEPPVTTAPDVPQTPVPEPPAPEQTAPAADPPAPAPPEPAPPEPAPPAPTATEPAADPVPPAPAPEAPTTAPAPAPEG